MKLTSTLLASIALLCFGLFMNACKIEKRLYSNGYHVSHAHHKSNITNTSDKVEANRSNLFEQVKIAKSENTEFSRPTEESITASSDDQFILTTGGEKIESNSLIEKSSEQINKTSKTHKKIFKKGNQVKEEGMSGLAIAGLACSLLGFFLVLIVGWPFFLGTIGTVLSAIGLGQTVNKGKKGKGLAIAGLALGIITIILFWIYVAILGSLFF